MVQRDRLLFDNFLDNFIATSKNFNNLDLVFNK